MKGYFHIRADPKRPMAFTLPRSDVTATPGAASDGRAGSRPWALPRTAGPIALALSVLSGAACRSAGDIEDAERTGSHASADRPRVEIVSPDAAITAGDAGGDGETLAYVEPFVAVRPGSPLTLFGGAILVSPEAGRPVWTCAILSSRDGGASWERRRLELEACVDPWVVYPDPGTVLFSAIEVLLSESEGQRLRLVLMRSVDDGRSWERGPDLGRGHDHELVTIDRSGGPRDGTVYVTAQRALPPDDSRTGHLVPVYRSTDGGATFELATELRLDDRPLRPTGLEVLSDGTLVLTIHDRPPEASADGRPGEEADAGATGRNARRAWALSSADGGRTWTERRPVTEACGPSPSLPGYPALARDGTDGPFRDRLYHVCVRTGLDGIAVTTSDDGGRTWSEPVRADRTGLEGGADVRSPAVAVGPDGVVGLVWHDRGDDPERRCQRLYFTASIDGGTSFLPPVRVSRSPSCPDALPNARVGRSWPTGGDYGTLSVDSDGLFHTAWADARSGTFQLHHATLSVRADVATSAAGG